MTTIITGWSPDGFELYGRRMVETFRHHWPKTTRLIAYVERVAKISGVDQVLISDVGPLMSFLARHRGNPLYEGTAIDEPGKWKAKDREAGYNFRFDAVKFGRVPFYIHHAAEHYSDKIMAWLDGDTYTFLDVPADFIEQLVPDRAAVAFLGRGEKHSEVGFLGFRLFDVGDGLWNPIIDRYRRLYDDDYFAELGEFHSAHIFDQAVAQCRQDGVICHDMTPGGRGHVWFQSPLGDYMDHLKGHTRKKHGHSQERRGWPR